MRVLMLGVYDINGYSRGRILYKGLQKNDVDVELFAKRDATKYLSIARRLLRKDYDIILATGKIVMLIAWFLKFWHGKKIVFDVFISDYDTLVVDRKLVKKGSIKAKLLWWGDKISCMIADFIIHDTRQHIDYFVEEFKLKREKFEDIIIGADDEIFMPLNNVKHDKFNVVFHGTFIPLQGIEYIIKAAELLKKEDIRFIVLGAGQTFDEMKKLYSSLNLDNIYFKGMIPIEKVPAEYIKADVGLGIFGDTPKTLRVIPNKAYEIIAMKVPLITADTPAIKSLFKDRKNAILCRVADSKSLAEAILFLKKNPVMRRKIADAGYKTFVEKCSNQAIGKRLVRLLDNWMRC